MSLGAPLLCSESSPASEKGNGKARLRGNQNDRSEEEVVGDCEGIEEDDEKEKRIQWRVV